MLFAGAGTLQANSGRGSILKVRKAMFIEVPGYEEEFCLREFQCTTRDVEKRRPILEIMLDHHG